MGTVWLSSGCPVVVFSPNTMNPGDTVNVTIKMKINDSEYVDYSPGTLFNIGIWSGSSYGTLLANGVDSTSFDDVTMPIKLIAADSLTLIVLLFWYTVSRRTRYPFQPKLENLGRS